jgi:hypothetical protein
MVVRMRKILAVLTPLLAATCAQAAAAAGQDAAWTIVLHPADFVIGAALGQLHTRHTWPAGFDDQSGAFQVALRKTAVAIPAPQCRMDYLILDIPSYYPETPKQASGRGRVTARVEAPLGLSRTGPSGVELVACNLYFVLPLSVQASPAQ